MKSFLKIIVIVFLSTISITILQFCKKSSPPTITTVTVSAINSTSAVSGGDVTNNGGEEVIARGVCWGTNSNPTISSSKTSDGTGNGPFTSNITGLTANTNYHVRAYATNSEGTGYGDDVPFTTSPGTPSPVVGTITQPTCAITTGSAVLSNLPATGTWTLTRTPGVITTTGTGTSITISGLAAGNYTFTVTDASGGVSAASVNVVINTPPELPSTLVIGAITQPTCAVATGSVILSGLPAIGSWTLTRSPGGTTTTGTGTSTTVSGLLAGTYTFTVTNASGCVSAASGNVIINAQPGSPSAPVVGTITQPTCAVATGSVILSGLPATGSWTLTRTPGGTTTTGTGTSTTVSGLLAGTYTFTVTNATGCVSAASGNVIINAQPGSPSAPLVGTITQPTCAVTTGSVILSGLPSTGTWTLTRSPGGTTTTGTGTSKTISGLPASTTYTFTVTNSSGCVSSASGNIVILQPAGPSLATTNTATNIGTTTATLNGTVNANGSSTTVTFEYGLTTSFGSNITATQSPVTGTSNTAVSATVTGLSANTTYYFRVKAVNCGGTKSGSTFYLKTSPYPTNGLISYFNFDGTLKDLYNNTPEGINYGSAGFITGKAGYAINLNGTSQYIQFARKTFKSGNYISVAFWLKKSNTSEALKYFLTCSDFGLWTQTGTTGIAISLPTTNSAGGNIAANTWVHFVGTYDGIYIRAYINGLLVETTYHPGSISNQDQYLTLGNFYKIYWGGSIDDLFIYNRVLTQTEVNQLFTYH